MVGISSRVASGVARRGVDGGENERFDFAAGSDAAEEGETGISTGEDTDFMDRGSFGNGPADDPDAASAEALPDSAGTRGETFGRKIGVIEDVHGSDDING